MIFVSVIFIAEVESDFKFKNFITSIDLEAPNLENEHIKKVYEITKTRHKPGKSNSSKRELKPESEGGHSYWSYKTHRWVKGKFDRRTKQFIPPAKDLWLIIIFQIYQCIYQMDYCLYH